MMAGVKARFDWLAELGGASALGLGGGFAALVAGPSLGLPAAAAMVSVAAGGFVLGLAAMRAVRPEARSHALPALALPPLEEEALLLEEIAVEPLLPDQLFVDCALLLEDRLPEPEPDSRVVHLFAAQPMPTPGQLLDRIDRHLAAPSRRVPPNRPPPPDATQALFAALDDLKRSLR